MQRLIQVFSQSLPVLLLLVVMLCTLLRGKDAYSAFVRGAGQGIRTAVQIMPYVAAMLVLNACVTASGLLQVLETILGPLFGFLSVPRELMGFALLRPFSGSGALALLSDICTQYGAQSPQAFTAAVMMGSTETLFYTFALYFGAAGVKKTRYALLAAMLSTLAGYAASAWICAQIL